MQDVTLWYENEWKSRLLESIRDKPRCFTCISMNEARATVLLTNHKKDGCWDFSHILFKWSVKIYANVTSETFDKTQFSMRANFASEAYDETYFDENFFEPHANTTILRCIMDVWSEQYFSYKKTIEKEINILKQETKHYFIALKQQHVERKITILCIISICDWYATKTAEEFAEITNHKHAEMVLWNVFLVENVAKYL